MDDRRARPAVTLVRVFPRAGVDRLRPGVWADVPDDAHLADLLSMNLVTLTDDHGNGAPDALPPPRCCQ